MKNIKQFLTLFRKDKISISLGIGSLTIGIAVSLIIGLWYWNEKSFDTQHPDANNTYRIVRKVFMNNQSLVTGSEFSPFGKTLVRKFPEVKDAVRVLPLFSGKAGERINYGGKTHFLPNIKVADTNFFSFFHYDIVKGSLEDFRTKPNSALIDEYAANVIFQGEDPIGKTIELKGKKEIVGILKNAPGNTHLTFHMLLSLQSIPDLNNYGWGSNDFYMTYVKLTPNSNKDILAKKMLEEAQKAFEAYKTLEVSYFFQPLKAIHTSTGIDMEAEAGIKKTNPKVIETFFIIGLIILLISCINFINLFISGAFLRSKSIGIKKTNGATRYGITMGFISETFAYTFIATVLALALVYMAMPYFENLIGSKLTFNILNLRLWILLIGLNVFIGMFAGFIPGFYMSGFKTLETLKGRFRTKRVISLQKGLVISQFAASIVLLIGVFVINKQINFMSKADLGFRKEQVISMEAPFSYSGKMNTIVTELRNNPNVKYVSISNGNTLEWRSGNLLARTDKPEQRILAEQKSVTHDYFDVLGMKMIEGSNTMPNEINTQSKPTQCILNEEAVKALGLKKPVIGQQVIVNSSTYTIAGIIKNAYTKTLSKKVDPQVYLPATSDYDLTLMVKTTPDGTKEVLNRLKKQWQAQESEIPFTYAILDTEYANLYKTEEQSGKIALITMIIAIFLTVAGLWGMSKYSSDLRTKEIGVRKVNGSSISEVMIMLNSEFLKWVGIAFLLAVPAAWFVTQRWLQGFVLKTSVSWWIFALAGFITISIALFTVSWQSWRAATRNPVEALRYE